MEQNLKNAIDFLKSSISNIVEILFIGYDFAIEHQAGYLAIAQSLAKAKEALDSSLVAYQNSNKHENEDTSSSPDLSK